MKHFTLSVITFGNKAFVCGVFKTTNIVFVLRSVTDKKKFLIVLDLYIRNRL